MSAPTLRRNYLYTVAVQAVSMLTPLLTAPYVARVLGEQGVGTYSYALSVATVFSLFAAWGFNTYGLREMSRVRDDPAAVSRLFWELTLLRGGTTLLAGGVYLWLCRQAQPRGVFVAMGCLLVATALDLTWFLQAMERFGTLLVRHVAVKTVSLLLIFIWVRDAGDVAVYAALQTGSTAVSYLLLWPSLRRWVGPCPRGLRPLSHLRPSWVYFVPTLATSVYTVLDKTMIGLITQDMAQNGYYESAHKIIHLLLSAITSLNVVVGVRTSYLFGQRRRQEVQTHVVDTYRFMCALALPLCGGVLACGNAFTVTFFGTAFAPAGRMLLLLTPLLFLVGTSHVLGSLYLTPGGYRRRSNRAILAGAAVNFTLNLALIPALGGYGAALASVAAEGVIAALYLRFSHDFVSAWRLLGMVVRYGLYGAAVFVAAWTVGRGMPLSWWAVLTQTAVGVTVYGVLLALFRDPLWDVWKKLRRGEDAS